MAKSNKRLLLGIAVGVAILVFGAYFRNQRQTTGEFETKKLFAELDIEAIERIEIAFDDDSFAISKVGDVWGLDSKAGYPIDGETLRELVLNIATLEAPERMTDKPANYDRLGVGEDNAVNGRVKMIGAENNTLVDLFVGEERRGKPSSPGGFAPAAGQYVRAAGDPWVYQIKDALTVESDQARWLANEILKVEADVLQTVKIDSPGTTDSFSIAREATDPFDIVTPIPAGWQAKTYEVRNISRSLSSLTLEDVYPTSDAAVQDLVFDATLTATQKNGLVYTAATSKQGEDHFLKLSASYDRNADLSLVDESTSDSIAAKELPAAEEAAAELNARHAPWIYTVASYQYDKLRKPLSDLLEEAPEEEAVVEPDAIEAAPEPPAEEKAPPEEAKPESKPTTSSLTLEQQAEWDEYLEKGAATAGAKPAHPDIPLEEHIKLMEEKIAERKANFPDRGLEEVIPEPSYPPAAPGAGASEPATPPAAE